MTEMTHRRQGQMNYVLGNSKKRLGGKYVSDLWSSEWINYLYFMDRASFMFVLFNLERGKWEGGSVAIITLVERDDDDLILKPH